jgi:hypothetical protein
MAIDLDSRPWLPSLSAVTLVSVLVLCARGQDAKRAADEGVEHWKKAAASYAISSGDNPDGPKLTLREEPVLRWNNPVRNAVDGAVFVWTDRGRPEVVASIYRYGGEGSFKEDHEFMSVSSSPLVATQDKLVAWSPTTGGATAKPIPAAPKPAATPSERLRQMRTLARDFRAYFDNPPDRSEIRLLTQPIYRYEIPPGRTDVIDGGLFAFVHTTDPEVLLLIEARAPEKGGPPQWHYALARMSLVNLRVRLKESEVWSAEWDSDVKNPRKTYMARTVDVTEK